MKRFQVLVVMLLSSVAFAQESGESGATARPGEYAHSSVLSGKALRGGTTIHGQIGWPGLSATLLTSAGSNLDIGGRFSLLYGYEGITRVAGIPGLKMQGVLRLELLERGRINLGLKFSPGLFVYFFPGGTEIGMPLPIDLAFGFAVTPKLMLNAGLDLPIFAAFGPYGGLAVPVLLGGGVEYALDRQLALTFNLRVGPSVPLTGNGYYSSFWQGYWCFDAFGRPYQCGAYYSNIPALETLFGLSYRL